MDNNYTQELQKLADKGQLRQFRPLSAKEGCNVEYGGRTMLNMTSNDYMGIGGDRKIHEDFYKDLNDQTLLSGFGLGAASSRLLTGDTPLSHKLEEVLCREYGRSACLLFNSGYHANIGILPTLTTKKDLIVSDKLNHASIHDGILLSRATHKRYRHLDYQHLEKILAYERQKYNRVIIVSESVFSMDGDVADLNRLVQIKRDFDCLLYIDEAHGIGVYGDRGLGKAEEYGVLAEIDLLVGTFGKACASVGAFVVCAENIYQYLINFSRSLIFTTALPPVVISWNYYVFNLLLDMKERRSKLAEMSNGLRRRIQENGLSTAGSTNIVPVIIGDNQKSVDMAEYMQNKGYLIFAVRPPTVPQGTARFRLSLTANMGWSDLQELPAHIVKGMQNT